MVDTEIKTTWLLIARRFGSSSSRRQRRYGSEADARGAVERWRARGFNTWWIFGPPNEVGDRELVEHWTDAKAGT